MQYTIFPKLNIKVSRFGMGCMRFPKKTDETGKRITDEQESIKMIRYAIENGVNYFDTAYVYKDSEATVGKALNGGLREKIFLATKSPVGMFQKQEDFDFYLDESLKRLQTGYIDFYLLHGLNKKCWEKVKKFKLIDKLDNAKKDGKIIYRAFSFHDDLNLFKEIIDSYNWDMCQIQLNFIGENFQAGVEGLKYAASKGIGVVIMEPLLGGLLGENVPSDILEKWNSSGIKRTPADWAFRWVANFPEVTLILSGVSTMEQLKENIKIFGKSFPDSMTEIEAETFKEVKKLYDKKLKIKCTGCSYCMPCPSGVDIPGVLWQYNSAFRSDPEIVKEGYGSWFCHNKMDASQCIECGECEEKCPQHIAIIDELKAAHEYLKSK
ncbi:MAG TPA: aldo/keto reductase [Candidatus Humimicrobiaceae bacterium]|nr:aldo/keto reductase [Candidatus Humimicrobiaceae bacterium]